jgi:hypothetical protein
MPNENNKSKNNRSGKKVNSMSQEFVITPIPFRNKRAEKQRLNTKKILNRLGQFYIYPPRKNNKSVRSNSSGNRRLIPSWAKPSGSTIEKQYDAFNNTISHESFNYQNRLRSR